MQSSFTILSGNTFQFWFFIIFSMLEKKNKMVFLPSGYLEQTKKVK